MKHRNRIFNHPSPLVRRAYNAAMSATWRDYAMVEARRSPIGSAQRTFWAVTARSHSRGLVYWLRSFHELETPQ